MSPVYATKQSYGEARVILELWGMRSIPLFPSLKPEVEAADKVLSMYQIELFDIQTVPILNWIIWNRTVFTFNFV